MNANTMIESTMTWHRCSRYMSKQGLEVLFDSRLLPNLNSTELDFCEIVYMINNELTILSTSFRSFCEHGICRQYIVTGTCQQNGMA